MELNDYGLERHNSGQNEVTDNMQPRGLMGYRQGTERNGVPNIGTMAAAMRHKEDEFIDHSLLAPTFIRDSNNFIIDMIEPPVAFSKSVVNVSTATIATQSNDGGYAVKETLSSEMHFQNSIFHFVNKAGDWQEAVVGVLPVSSSGSTLNTAVSTGRAVSPPPPLALPPMSMSSGSNAPFHLKHVSEEFIALSGDDFVGASEPKRFCVDSRTAPNGNASAGNAGGIVQQFPALSLLGDTNVALDDVINDDCDFLYEHLSSARKVLPHKKRISRKLKVAQEDGIELFDQQQQQQQQVLPLDLPKLTETRFNTGVVSQFNCELCGHSTSSQLNFFAHLKEHYEPIIAIDPLNSSVDTVNSSMDDLPSSKNCENICSLEKKSEDHAFADVNLNFEPFPSVDERVVIDKHNQHHHLQQQQEEDDDDDIKILRSASIESYSRMCHRAIAAESTAAASILPLKYIAEDEVEFSDTEDMLEGIRNVVDKVSIEDTCDEIDLMNTMRAPWFSNDSNAFKSKTFSDLTFTGALAQLRGGGVDDESVSNLEAAPKNIEAEICNKKAQKQLSTSSSEEGILELADRDRDAAVFYTDAKSVTDVLATTTAQLDTGMNDKCSRLRTLRPREKLAKIWGDIGIGNMPKEGTQEAQKSERMRDDCSERKTDSDNSKIGEDDDLDDEDDCDYVGEDAADEAQFDGSGDGYNSKRHVCATCKRSFNSSNALKYHIRTHTGERPHPCELCGRSFFARSALNSHIRTHTGDKPFECDQCDRKFRQWGDLKFHIISIHTAEKSHQCEFCGKAFSRKYSLVLHRRIHTSERNYKCEFCEKCFRASSYLQNHRKIHTGEKPFSCEECGKKFRVSGDLRRHERTHQPKEAKQRSRSTASTTKSDAAGAKKK